MTDRLPKPHRFIVYHVASTMEKRTFVYRHHAQALCDKLNAAREPQYAVTGIDDYRANVVKMVERVNMMTGEKYMEPSNTPGYMSPSRESYWSM